MVWHFQLKVSLKKAEGSQQAGSAGNTSTGVLAPSCDPITPALRGVVAWGITGGLAAHSGHPQKRWDLSGYGRRTNPRVPAPLFSTHVSMAACKPALTHREKYNRRKENGTVLLVKVAGVWAGSPEPTNGRNRKTTALTFTNSNTYTNTNNK